MGKKGKTKKVTFTLDSNVIERLEIVSKESKINKSKLLSDLIDKYLLKDRFSSINNDIDSLSKLQFGKSFEMLSDDDKVKCKLSLLIGGETTDEVNRMREIINKIK